MLGLGLGLMAILCAVGFLVGGGVFMQKEKGTYQVQLMIESGGMEKEANFEYGVAVCKNC